MARLSTDVKLVALPLKPGKQVPVYYLLNKYQPFRTLKSINIG